MKCSPSRVWSQEHCATALRIAQEEDDACIRIRRREDVAADGTIDAKVDYHAESVSTCAGVPLQLRKMVLLSNGGGSAAVEVAIVGGGIGGLCLAIGLLKKTSVRVQVYEAASKFAEVGAGVALGPNAQRALGLISPDVEAAYLAEATGNLSPGFKDTWFEFLRGTGPAAGEVLANIRNSTGQSTVHRAKFLDGLVKLLPVEVVHVGKRLQAIQQTDDARGKVALTFEDGTSVTADCVLGADGLHSAVRRHLLGASHPATRPRFTGSIAYRGLIPMELARAKLGRDYADDSRMWCGHMGMVMSYPIDEGRTLNVVASRDGQSTWDFATSAVPATKEQCRTDFADWAAKAQEVIEVWTTRDP